MLAKLSCEGEATVIPLTIMNISFSITIMHIDARCEIVFQGWLVVSIYICLGRSLFT